MASETGGYSIDVDYRSSAECDTSRECREVGEHVVDAERAAKARDISIRLIPQRIVGTERSEMALQNESGVMSMSLNIGDISSRGDSDE